MKYMTTAEIREAYLKFFEERGSKRVPSSSLIPDDPSMLLTSAGMVQFKPYFLQQKHLEEPYVGTTTVQKCVRTNDIDIIGRTGRHLSFFEMLGNFSFGAYFKQEACEWALEFSCEVLGLPQEKIFFTVFTDDDETIEIWKGLGIDPAHISRLGEEDNFWRAGPTGPCGPCSELYFDQGVEHGCGSPDCAPGCDCDRFLEYWNLVFTQYDGQEDGTLVPLPKKNIDTGMGLERMASIMQGVHTNYETDILRGLIAVGERLSGREYGSDKKDDLALRIMADHSRAVTFMIADGILPANEGRGYVLRRLLRRAVLKGHLLGIEGAFLNEFIDEIVATMGDVYPEIRENRELTRRVVLSEEDRFGATLRQGQAYLEQKLGALEETVLPGSDAFTLYDTYGFPLEVTQEIAEERGITVDTDGFDFAMQQQRERARASAKGTDEAWSTFDGVMSAVLESVGPTQFVGYDEDSARATVVALVKDGAQVEELDVGETGMLVLSTTPFYAEKGGQVADVGIINSDSVSLSVVDTQEPETGLTVHTVEVNEGLVAVGDEVQATIDISRRERIRRNHTATHILHWALREVLGEHVKQAGSMVAPNRLRFDFTHFEAVSEEQLSRIEQLSNEKIMENYPVHAYETSITDARSKGVIALFGEKYGEVVRVLDIEGFSQELCGGTHVRATSEIGFVKVISESSVGANLRRIEAVTSYDALAFVNKIEAELKETAAEMRVPLFDVSERAAANIRQIKELNDKRKHNKEAAQEGEFEQYMDQIVDVGYPLLIARIDGVDAGGMRHMWDIVRRRMATPGAVVFAGDNKGTPLLMAAGTDESIAAGFDAGKAIKQISPHIKGGGGGKPTMAQAGGKSVEGIDAALEAARALFTK